MSLDDPATHVDATLGFTLPDRSARGRLVRLGPVLDSILSAHAYPEPLARLLAEALTLTVLIGSTLRADEGQTTVQAQAKGGPIDLLVCDYLGGAIRGYAQVADGRQASEVRRGMPLGDLFGEGYLAVTLDQAVTGERHQAITPLEGASFAGAIEAYFASSEQIPTLVRVGVDRTPEGWVAGGLLLQHLPRGEEGGERLNLDDAAPAGGADWSHVQALAGTISPAELIDARLPLTDVLWRLFSEDLVKVLPPGTLARGCRCTTERFRDVLQRFPEEELAAMRGGDGLITVDCAFCARAFPVNL